MIHMPFINVFHYLSLNTRVHIPLVCMDMLQS